MSIPIENSTSLIARLEELTRKGLSREVESLMAKLNIARIARPDAMPLANLARRNGLRYLALKILNPIVRSEIPIHPKPTGEEWSEYAMTLGDIGARREAAEILASISPIEVPQSLLYRSFLHFSNWDYQLAIPLLEEYSGLIKADEYQSQVAHVNMSAALIFTGQFTQAQNILDQLSQEVTTSDRKLLKGNIFELLAQVHLGLRNFDKATHFLSLAATSLSDAGSLSRLFVDKWKIIIDLKKKGASTGSLNSLDQLKTRALKRGDWETVREADFYSASLSKNLDRLAQVYFGTAHEGYRKYLLESMDFNWTPPKEFIWNEKNSQAESKIIFDLDKGYDNLGLIRLKPGFVLYRCLHVLARDFYSPIPLGLIFSELFPDEVFNPYSAPNRIYQVIHRLRTHFKAAKIPLQIESSQGFYRISSREDCGLLVRENSAQTGHQSQQKLMLHSLKTEMGRTSFKTSSACNFFQISPSAFHRWSRWAIEEGDLTKKGLGKKIEYNITEANHLTL